MSATRLKAGVIGLGVGERHAAAFASHPDCALHSICDIDAVKLDEVGRRFPEARRLASADALIDDPDLDIVVVASYDDAHAGQVVQALDAGKHVFAEKPLCRTAGELAEIRSALRRHPSTKLSSNTLLRSSPRFQDLRKRIETGGLGRLYCIETDYLYGRFHKITGGWRGQIPDYSVVLGGGIHVVDLVLWLSGERPHEVSAVSSSLVSGDSGFAGPDCVLALLKFRSGLIAKVGANFGCVHPHFHKFTAWGTKATFENAVALPEGAAALWEKSDPEVAPTLLKTAYPGVDKGILIPSFVDAILGRGQAVISEEEVFAAVSTCLAIDAAHKSGRPTPVTYA